LIFVQRQTSRLYARLVAVALAASAAMLLPPATAQTPHSAVAPAQAAKAWHPETFELANGMTAVVLPDHRAPVVTHMIWYKVGSADEVPGKSGLAHFLEHLMFKATDEIPSGEYSKIVARNGGQDNASTSNDYTNYYFRIAKDRLPLMMHMEADRMTNLQLGEKEVESELQVVMSERRQNVDSDPGSILLEKVYAAAYPGHPYAVPVIGHMDEVAALTRADAVDWYKRWYGPEHAILVVAGDITAAELKKLADETYGKIPVRGDLLKRAWPAVKPIAKSVYVTHSDDNVRQPDWTRYWLGIATSSPDSEALQVGLEILGGGRTSRLNRELVEKQAIAVSAYAYSDEMAARGLLSIGASPAPGHTLADVRNATMPIVETLLRDGPTPEELDRAKRMIAASTTFARDSQVTMANWYGGQLVVGQTVQQIEGWDDRIRAVTAQQVVAALNKYITGQNFIDATLTRESK
jgi:zinc protease